MENLLVKIGGIALGLWPLPAPTVPKSLPKILGLGRRVIVVGSVISGKDRYLSSSVAADTLDGHLSNTKSSHRQRHGFYSNREE